MGVGSPPQAAKSAAALVSAPERKPRRLSAGTAGDCTAGSPIEAPGAAGLSLKISSPGVETLAALSSVRWSVKISSFVGGGGIGVTLTVR